MPGKKELATSVAKKVGLPVRTVENVLSALEDSIVEFLQEGDRIKFAGLILTVVETKERKVRNPRTGEEFIKPAGKKVKVKLGKTLRELFK